MHDATALLIKELRIQVFVKFGKVRPQLAVKYRAFTKNPKTNLPDMFPANVVIAGIDMKIRGRDFAQNILLSGQEQVLNICRDQFEALVRVVCGNESIYFEAQIAFSFFYCADSLEFK
jgi:hypothetical protein